MDEQQQATLTHVTDDHEFPADLCRSAVEPYMDLLHAALHDQRGEHLHRWVVVELHSGCVVSPPFESEKLARRRALDDFGPDAGKEYDVVRYVPRSLLNAKDVFLLVFDAPFALTLAQVAARFEGSVEVVEILARLQALGLLSGDTVHSEQLTWSSNLHESTSREEAEALFDRAWAVWDE